MVRTSQITPAVARKNAIINETLCSSIFNYSLSSNADAMSIDPFTFPVSSENKHRFSFSLDEYSSDKDTSINKYMSKKPSLSLFLVPGCTIREQFASFLSINFDLSDTEEAVKTDNDEDVPSAFF